MFVLAPALRRIQIQIAACLAVLHFAALRAGETAPPTPPEKCNCASTIKITVTPAAGRGVAPRADSSVPIQGFSFGNGITINVGDMVTWTNTDGAIHTVTNDAGSAEIFNSGNLSNGQTFSHTFNTAGTFPYHCAIHPFMTSSITVQAAGQAPVIMSSFTATNIVGNPFNYTLMATGTPTPTLSFTNVPQDLQISGAMLTGTFSAPAQYMIGLHATNTAGTDDKVLMLSVVGSAPAISSPLTANAVAGADFSYTIMASGTAPITFDTGALPPGFALNGATITGRFAAAGMSTLQIKAMNSAGMDTQNLVVTVAAATEGISGAWKGSYKGKAFSIDTNQPQSEPVNNPYTISFTQVGSALFANDGVLLLKGQIGLGNFWMVSTNTGQDTVVFSGHVATNGKSIKGLTLALDIPHQGSVETTFTLKRAP